MKSHWIIFGVGLILAGPGVFAQDMPAVPSTTTSSAPAMGTGMTGTMPDYSLLVNSPYDYTKLVQAKARGLSDAQIAAVAKISRQSGVSFREIVDAVLRGTTFSYMLQKYNLPLDDLTDLQSEEARIAAYKMAYEAASAYAMSGGQSMYSSSGMLSAEASRFQSMYNALPHTATGAAMQFPVTEQPPVSPYPTPEPAVRQPYRAPAPMPVQPIVRRTIPMRAVPVYKAPVYKAPVRRHVTVRPKRHVVPRRRVYRVKRVIIGS